MKTSSHLKIKPQVIYGIMIFLFGLLYGNHALTDNNADVENDSEIELIREAAMLYVDGVKYADVSKIEKAFHENWNMTGFYEDGEYRHFGRDEFLGLIERNRENAENFPRYEGGIIDVHYHKNTAVVKIRLENSRVIFTDHISLLKIDGTWKIIHKIWDTELQDD